MGVVLVGIDGSPESACALRWATWFATATRRTVHVAHAWQYGRRLEPLMIPVPDAATDVDRLESGIRERLREIAAKESGDAAPVSEYHALRGEAAEALLAHARQVDAALIVVGARGAGGALRVLLGSVSQQLVHCPTRAVAVVPDVVELPPAERPWSLVVGVDGSNGASRALRWAAASARLGGGEIVAVHALELPVPDMSPHELASVSDEMRQRLEEEWCAPLRTAGVTHRAQVERGAAAEVLARVADAVHPAGIVAGSRGLGAVSQRLLGSVTHRLVRESDWPTIVIPSPRDCVIWSI